jgi:hypothetical protein
VSVSTFALFKRLTPGYGVAHLPQKFAVAAQSISRPGSRFAWNMSMPQAMDRSFKTDLLADEGLSNSFAVPSLPTSDEGHQGQLQQQNHVGQDPVQREIQHEVHDQIQGDRAARPNTGDRRQPRDDRRDNSDRRANSLRRGRDRQRNASANQIAYLGTLLCALSVGLAIYAFLKPPITFTPSLKCAEGFGGQQVEHRGLSSLWAVAMVLAAAGLVIPDRKRRPVVLMVLCGVSVGLFAAAYFTVGTKLVGFCID